VLANTPYCDSTAPHPASTRMHVTCMRQPKTAAAALQKQETTREIISPPQVGPDGRGRQPSGGLLISNNRQTGCLCCQRKRNVTGATSAPTPHDGPISSTILVGTATISSPISRLLWCRATTDGIQIAGNNTRNTGTHPKDNHRHPASAHQPLPPKAEQWLGVGGWKHSTHSPAHSQHDVYVQIVKHTP
jgi:hypothetical protein